MSENNNQIENFNLARGKTKRTVIIPTPNLGNEEDVPKTVVGEWEEVKLSAKSNLVKEIAEKHGLKIVDIPLAAVDTEDTYGIPVPENVTIMGSGKFTPQAPTSSRFRHVEVDIQSPFFGEIEG